MEPLRRPPATLLEVVLPPHPQNRAHPREAVEHDGEQRPVPELDEGAGVDRVEELPRFRRREDRRRALGDDCFGPRTAAAGFTGRTWLTTSQSPSMRIAARCCFTVGTDPAGWVRMYAATWSGETSCSWRPRASHHPRNCPTARP